MNPELFENLAKEIAPCGECGTKSGLSLMYIHGREIWFVCANERCGVAQAIQPWDWPCFSHGATKNTKSD